MKRILCTVLAATAAVRGQDPTNLEITATKVSVAIYCQALGNEDTKISEAPHG